MAKIQGTKSKMGDLVVSALKKLMTNTGWTSRTIIKFVKLEYKISDARIGSKISRVLKRGVRNGTFQTENGRYRLSARTALGPRLRHPHTQKHRKRNRSCTICRR